MKTYLLKKYLLKTTKCINYLVLKWFIKSEISYDLVLNIFCIRYVLYFDMFCNFDLFYIDMFSRQWFDIFCFDMFLFDIFCFDYVCDEMFCIYI